MRVLPFLLCLFIALTLENHQQPSNSPQNPPQEPKAPQQESNPNQNANPNLSFHQKASEIDHQLSDLSQNQNMRTKATIVIVVVLLLCLLVKKCYKNKNKIHSQEKYSKHESNSGQREKQLPQDLNECPIIITFDIQTIKSKYLVQNYGLKASRLSETCSKPIMVHQ